MAITMNPNKCQKRIFESRDWHGHQCTKPVFEKDANGDNYCRIHGPTYTAEKDKKAREKYKEESCKKCGIHFMYKWFRFCPHCGTKKSNV